MFTFSFFGKGMGKHW